MLFSLIAEVEGGSKRVVGLMPEASAYGTTCLGVVANLVFLRPCFESARLRNYIVPFTILGLLAMKFGPSDFLSRLCRPSGVRDGLCGERTAPCHVSRRSSPGSDYIGGDHCLIGNTCLPYRPCADAPCIGLCFRFD